MTARDAYMKLLKALDTRLPDTEILGDGTVDQKVKKRMRVLNATAQAMIEECSAELQRHKPNIPSEAGIPTYERIQFCICGLRYTEPMPFAHQAHMDRILSSVILTIKNGVTKAKAINWHDVKEEADQWEKETSEQMRN